VPTSRSMPVPAAAMMERRSLSRRNGSGPPRESG
jgi:hypothetical protein